MSSGNDALLDDEDSLEDAIRKARKEFPRLCDSENEEGNFDISLHKSRVENFMERLAGECERRGFWLLRNDWLVLHSDLYQNPRQKLTRRISESRAEGWAGLSSNQAIG